MIYGENPIFEKMQNGFLTPELRDWWKTEKTADVYKMEIHFLESLNTRGFRNS